MNFPKVFIIILNWNGLQDTLECLESVYKLDYTNFHVIVVDNGSTDNSVTVIRETYPEVIIIENIDNLGYTGGNNIAMSYAMHNGADYMWLLNNDTIVEKDTLGKLVDKAEKNIEVGLISPILYYYDQPDRIQYCGSYIDWKNKTIVYPEERNLNISEDFKTGRNVCLCGTALLIKREVIEKIGYLDEKFFAYWEDTDYSTRVLKEGFRNIICTSSRIYHKAPVINPASIRRGSHYFYYMSRNRYLWATKDLNRLKKMSYLRKYLSLVILTVMYYSESNEFETANAYLDGMWAAFCGKSGPFDGTVLMPIILKKLFYLMSSWHPYMWANLFECKCSYIILESFRRFKLRMIER